MEVSLLTEKNQKLGDKVSEVEELLNKLRDQLSEATLQKGISEAESEKLASEISVLQERITELEGQTPLKSYPWTQRFLSIFWIYKS
jgi:coenzyme F420-reducing hydrogenase delta subunit